MTDNKKKTSDIDQIRKELENSEDRFKAIFDGARDGIIIADVESKKFHLGNKSIRQMLGYSNEEISGLGVMDIHPEEHLPYVIEQFEKQRKKEITLAKDIPVKRKD
ncbi:MAG: PAS domain S-box protein, partial [Planctomycetes bacterium]|nr:PAS domain S-box protein [Planctomycetota bacterium]